MAGMYCPHFADEHMEARRDQARCPKTPSGSVWTQAQGTLTPRPGLLTFGPGRTRSQYPDLITSVPSQRCRGTWAGTLGLGATSVSSSRPHLGVVTPAL